MQIDSGISQAGLLQAERREQRRYLLAVVPALVTLLILFVIPLIGILTRSAYKDSFTLQYYQHILRTPVYLSVLRLTFQTAAAVTLACLLFGYPVAYLLVSVRPRWRRLLLIVVVLPFFTSVIVRTYAWMVILGRNGIINHYLSALGLQPVSLLYNLAGVIIGMTYVLLPFMVLTLYSVMQGIDPGLIRAAHNLGASRLQAFRRIFLPLSFPGVAGGALLVFIMSLGFFITPALMGGPSDIMIAMLIEREVELTLNWGFASALAVVLLVLTLLGFGLSSRILRWERVFEGKT